ncbi:MAG: T9SS type A sorting domain-containing protein [Candidatus Azobacteroides sp.]|nr:T9SS type A sorting domain-containing protein [Candidatus Azobacteroides sp.]
MKVIKTFFITVISLFVTISAFAYSGGNGTEQYPYLISSKADMQELATNVNGGQKYAGIYFLLTRDLTGVDDVITTIIGNSATRYFSGIFDGGGYKIEVNINSSMELYVGIFGYVSGATIKNLGVAGSVTRNPIGYKANVGSVCGYAEYSTIINCYNAGSISSRSYTNLLSCLVGGICGGAESCTITDCYNVGGISSTSDSNAFAGGICGRSDSGTTITNCYNVGGISSNGSSNSEAGGICGQMRTGDNTIANCYNAGRISCSGSASNDAGGICGSAGISISITNCYNVGRISCSGSSAYAGGICGSAANITNCYNTGDISASTSGAAYSTYAGGICGYAGGRFSITNCYNVGNISSTTTNSTYNPYAGGICGYVAPSNNEVASSIINCIAANAAIIAQMGGNNNSKIASGTGRIFGGDNGNYSNYSIQNCYASATMQINNVTRSSQDANSKDGKDSNIIAYSSSTCSHSETHVMLFTINPLKWQYSINNGNSWEDIVCTSPIYTETNPSAGHYIYRAQNGDGTFSPYVEVTYHDAVPTTINTLPLTGTTKTVNESITFSLELQDDNYNYQWYKDNTAIEDATTNTLAIDIIKSVDAGIYKCKVWNGCNEIYSETSTLTVNKCPQVITFPEIPEKIYGDEAITLPEKTDKGLTITYQSTNTNVATVSGNVLTLKNPGTSTIIASQGGNDDYLLAPAIERTLTINKQTQTITFGEIATKRYGDPAFTLPATTDKGLTISYQIINTNVATVAGNTITIHNSGTTDIIASQVGDDYRYAATPVSQTLTVQKANQSITFANFDAKIYGDPNIELNQYSDAGLEITYTSDNADVATINGNMVVLNNVGSAQITATQNGNSNYNAAPLITRTLTVSKALQTIIFNELADKTYGDPAFQLQAIVNSNLPVTFESSNTNVATVSGNTLTVVNTGTAYITASVAGNDNYYMANPVQQQLTITKASLIVSVNNASRNYGVANPAFTINYSGFRNSETQAVLTIQPQAVCLATPTSDAGTHPITVSGGEATNYEFTYINGTLTINKVPVTVTAQSISSVYGDTPPLYTCQYVGFVNNETENVLTKLPALSCSATSQSNTGQYTITPSGAEAANYTFTYTSGTLTIGKRNLQVMPNNVSRVYGSANPAFTLSYNGFVNGNNDSNIATKPVATTTATLTSNVGEYPVTCSGGNATNYSFTYGTGKLTITKAPLTITAENKQREQGKENPSFTLSYSGFKNNENESVLNILPSISCIAYINSSVGFYDIVLSGGSDKNYNYTLINGKLEITAPNGLGEINVSNVSVYPNPAKNYLFIQSDEPIKKVEIYNQSGMCVLINDNVMEKLDVSSLANGFYLARIYVDGILVIKKIIIKK